MTKSEFFRDFWRCLRDLIFSRFGTIPACDGRTDRWTHDDSIYRASIASRGKKSLSTASANRGSDNSDCAPFGAVNNRLPLAWTSGYRGFAVSTASDKFKHYVSLQKMRRRRSAKSRFGEQLSVTVAAVSQVMTVSLQTIYILCL